MSAHAAPATRPRLLALALPRAASGAWMALGVAAALTAVAFAGNGGSQLGQTTAVELALLTASGLLGAATVATAPARGRWWGLGTAALFLAFAGWTTVSIVWAVEPADAWVEANRTITYVACFAAGLCLVRLAPGRWEGVLAGILLSAFLVSGWALLTKVFPGALDADELSARLRAPFGYWNATGLYAALGIPACVWLGARRHGHAAANALAYPALGVLIVALLLSYSRGALLAVALGLIFWFAVVPLRLRGAAVLLCGAAAGVPVALWAFARPGLTTDRLGVGLRAPAGHDFGALLLALVLVLAVVGVAVGFRAARRAPRPLTRRRLGATLLVALALAPIGGAAYLVTTDRGFGGSISHAWTTLTDPHAVTPPNDPSRLTAIGSVRSRYWNEALKMFRDHPWMGVGADGYGTLRTAYRDDTLQVRHAHGFVVQTLADLGIVGMALALAALAAWLLAAARATGLRRADRGLAFPPERIGLLTLTAIVLVYGVHSFVDWTWYVPGCTLLALLAGAWVAGRGPLRERPAAPARLRLRLRGAGALRLTAAGAILLAALFTAWVVWQPLRSLDASNAALAALERGDVPRAMALARTAHDRDPLSLDPLSVLAVAQTRAGDERAALRTLQRQVHMQPANVETWMRLADFQLNRLHHASAAERSLRAALRLDPRDPQVIGAFVVARREARR